MCPKLLFFEIFLLVIVTGDPIVIRSGIIKDHSQHQSGNAFDATANKASSGYESEDGFDKGDHRKFVNAQDAGSYLQKDADKKLKQDQGRYGNQDFHENGEGSMLDSSKKVGHKKGQQKSGFHNTYHKDESGSNSSYFENENDEGGDVQRKSRRGNSGSAGSRHNQGGFEEGSHREKDDSKQGGYKKGGHLAEGLGNNRNYNQEIRHDERRHQGQSNAANQYGEAGKQIIEKQHAPHYIHENPRIPYINERPYIPEQQTYAEEPYYYQDNNYYERPEKNIIIYEDPRYVNGAAYTNYDAPPPYDGVRLDVRRPPIPIKNRYYEQRPVYEDYYY